MKALVLNTSLKKAIVEDVSRPSPGSNEILVNVRAIALNPVDELYVSSPIAAQEKRIIGTDFAGVVVEVGSEISDLSGPRVKVGTRVAGFLQGGTYFTSNYLRSD
jgi:NADPH:quinone reductase-like Zn-dependent oxidoreductase